MGTGPTVVLKKKKKVTPADRLAAQAVRCHCGAKPTERCRTTAKAQHPGSSDCDASESGALVLETDGMGRTGTVILFLVGWLTGGIAGGLVVAFVLAGRKPPASGRWVATCGACAREQVQGPRTQLYVELWDSYGMMYEHYPVGVGEMLNTQPVGPWLTDRLRSAVERLNVMQQAGRLRILS